MYPFIGIKSIDDLVKNAMLSQTAVPYGEQGAGSSAGNPDLLVTPVSSIKLPGASKKSKRKYPQDILDEAKIMTQGKKIFHLGIHHNKRRIVMDINFLSQKYASKDLDLMQAIRIWKENRISPEGIRDQVRYDIGMKINSADAKTLYRMGSELEKGDKKLEEFGMSKGNENNDPFFGVNYANQNKNYGGMEAVAKVYPVSKGREELLPDNIRNRDKIKFTPSIRKAFERVSENIYRDKYAAKYWTLKEKMGEDGKKAIFLVAVETDDSVKTASMRRADAPAGTVGAPEQTGAQPGTQATPTDPGLQQAAPGSNPGVPGNPPAANPAAAPQEQQQSVQQQAAGMSATELAKNITDTLGARTKEIVDLLYNQLNPAAAPQQAAPATPQPTPGV